jgi:hypothetical protein
MATRSMVGIWNEETGEVTASYVHYDGYIAGVGAELLKSYNDAESASMVATGGYLSSLNADYSESRSAAVHSDKAVSFASVEDFLEEGFDYAGAEYIYLWDGETWFVSVNTVGGVKSLFEEVAINLAA